MIARKSVCVLLTLCLGLALQPAHSQNPVDEIQSLTLQWTGLKHQNDTLIASWRQEQPVQQQRLALLEREQGQLSALLEKTAAQQDQVEQHRLDLLEEQSRLENEQMSLERELGVALIAIEELHVQLPPPLAEAWDELVPRLENEELGTSDRLQALIDMLGQLDDFRRKVTLNQAVMTMADGKDYLVKQVYLGISHGWYVSADGEFAAAGRAESDAWQWQPITDSASVRAVVAILERRRSAELVSLPLELDGPTGGPQ